MKDSLKYVKNSYNYKIYYQILGATGLIGKFLKFVSPLTIAPTVALVGLTLFKNAADAASKHWGVAAG